MMTSKRNVIMISPYFYPLYGGTENQAFQLVKYLKPRGYTFQILTLGADILPEKEVVSDDISIYRFGNFLNESGIRNGYREIRHWLSKAPFERYIGIHQQLIYGANIDQQLKLGTQAHRFGAWQIIKITSTDKVRLLTEQNPEIKKLFQRAKGIIALNGAIEKELTDLGVPFTQIYRISNGVDSGLFSPPYENEKINMRLSLGLPSKCFVFLFVGRLVYKKGLDLLLTAWQYFSRDKLDAFLLIVGDDYYDVLKRQSSVNKPCGTILYKLEKELNLPRIVWVGRKEHREMPPLYQAADCFILPSRNEGMSNAILEALSTGLPIIGSAIPGISELVVQGVNGFIFEKGNLEQLIKSLNYIYFNRIKLHGFGKASRELICNKYDFEIIAAQYDQLYTNLSNY